MVLRTYWYSYRSYGNNGFFWFLFFAFIGEKIINKEEKESKEETNLYSYDIAKKVKTYLLIQIITLISAFLLSLILMYEKKDDNEDENIMSDIEKTTQTHVFNEETKNEANIEDDKNKIKEKKKE